MLEGRKTTEPEQFVTKRNSLLLTIGDIRNGDFSQDFALVSVDPTPDLEALGVVLGVQGVRHPEVLAIFAKALSVIKDPETWEAEGKEIPANLNFHFPD